MDAKLTLSRREVFGKKAKTLTDDGKTLANIFGKGRNSVAAFGDTGVVEKVVSAAGKNTPITITLDDGKDVLALVHEVERDYKTNKIHHVSFQVIIKGQKVTTEVPIHQTGEASAQKTGLIVVTVMDSVEIEAIPSKIPSALEVSVDGLVEDGDSVHLSDITVPEGAEIMIDIEEDDRLIAKVETPRAEVEEEDEDEDGEEADAADVPSEHGGGEDGDDSGEEKTDSDN